MTDQSSIVSKPSEKSKKAENEFYGERQVFLGDYVKRKRRWAFFWGVLITSILCSIIFSTQHFSSGYPSSGDHIASIKIEGGIFDDEYRDDMLKEIRDRDDVRALIVNINSPGGGVYASERLFYNIRKIAEHVPVVTVMQDYAASGGYITAMAADHIIAGETTVTGSIGVIYESVNISDVLDRVGIETTLVRSSDAKGGISPLRDPTPEELRDEEALIGGMYDWFRDLVGERRGLSGNALNAVTQGTVFTGLQALDANLIDEIGAGDEALDYLYEQDKALGKLDVVNWEPIYPEFSGEGYVGALANRSVEEIQKSLADIKVKNYQFMMR